MDIKILENLNLKNINIDKKSILMLTGSILLCLSAGIIGKLTVSQESLIWYDYLFKPALTPPAWLFTGMWILLYLLIGFSLFLLLKNESTESKKIPLIFFGLQLFLNYLWFPVFFGLKSLIGGFIISLLICISLYLIFYKTYKISKSVAFLMIPPILWVSLLIGINFTFCLLNNTQWVFWSFKHNLI